MSATSGSRQASLDALRVLGVFGVVSIHASFVRSDDPLAFYLDEVGRFAVPMFFILSGYFWTPEQLAAPTRLATRTAGRVMLAFIAFLALNICLSYLIDADFALDLSATGLFLMVWAGEPAHYLWFLTALVVGTFVVGFATKYLGVTAVLLLSAGAYVLGCIIGAYGEVLLGEQQPTWYYRNGLLFAPLFLAIGMILRRHGRLLAGLPLIFLVLAVPVAAFLQIAEGRLLLGRAEIGHDFGFATAPYAVAMVLLFLRLPIGGAVWTTLGRSTFAAYLVHIPLLKMFDLRVLPSLPLPLLILACGAISMVVATCYTLLADSKRPR